MPSKPRLRTKVITDTNRAKLFACSARWSPKNRVSAPPAIGSQISRLSRGHEENIFSASLSSSVAELRQHREGVVIEVAGLRAATDGGDTVEHPGRAVDEDAVDDAAVADLRRELAEG